MFSDKSVYLFLLATSLGLISVGTAFTTPSFAGVNTRRTVFGVASTPLYVSDEEAAVSTTMDENVDAPVDLQEEASAATIPEISSEEAHTDVVGNVDSLDASPELTPEEQAAANKRKVERERHTLFVGNLPFGTFHGNDHDRYVWLRRKDVFLFCIGELTHRYLSSLRYSRR